jgi:hypothetical protein
MYDGVTIERMILIEEVTGSILGQDSCHPD